MKKILIVLLFLAVAGAGIGGTLYFKGQVKTQTEQNNVLISQNAQVQAQLNAIGSMTTVYQVNLNTFSGQQVKDSDLIAVSIPMSAVSGSTVTNKAQVVGLRYKTEISKGTILSADMLMDDTEYLNDTKYPRTISFTSLPKELMVGDFVDIRLLLPNGEEYVVMSKVLIQDVKGTTITINVSEEEHFILNAMMQDAGNYEGFCLFYMVKYLEPGMDDATIAFYPVQHEMENFVKFNPNIADSTRCINTTLRDHIDEVFILFTNSDNEDIAKTFIKSMETQLDAQLKIHEQFVEDNTDEDGNYIYENGKQQATGKGNNFQTNVNEAADSLQNNLNQLGGIQ